MKFEKLLYFVSKEKGFYMNRLILLATLFLLACSKDNNSTSNDVFQKLQTHMWKLDSAIYLENGRREVSIPPTMNPQYIKFTSTAIEYYYSYNQEPPIILETHKTIYKNPKILEAWFPANNSNSPSYKIEVQNVSDSRLQYNFLNTPDYAKTREYYYHAY